VHHLQSIKRGFTQTGRGFYSKDPSDEVAKH
jgi:hypothetical protein